MIDMQTVKMLAQYKAWADKVTFDGVAALPPGEAEKERKTLFKSIIGSAAAAVLVVSAGFSTIAHAYCFFS